MNRIDFLKRVLIIMALFGGAQGAAADSDFAGYPERPVTIVVTFPPGGGADLLARLVGSELEKQWNVSVIVENRAGASGNIAASYVSRRPADGYTLLMVNSSYAINPAIFKSLPFDPRRDLGGIVNFANIPSILVVPAESPYRSIADFTAAASKGMPVPVGSCGNGTPQHLAIATLEQQGKLSLQHVPYRGCGPAVIDVLGAQVPSAILTAASVLPYVRAGKLRALAVTSPERSPFLPQVPTVAESGFPGYRFDQWNGLMAPSGTPRRVLEKIHRDVQRVLAQPEIVDKLKQLTYVVDDISVDEFDQTIHDDIDRFARIAGERHITTD
ncbi:tripartite tricarboxylate transporter substrate binding protein [soil metagenome]